VCLLVGSPYGRSDRHGDAWAFRSIPFRAEYNDYGSIENVHPEDQFLVDLAIAQFNRDAIEIPQGENPYHDPPVTKGMPAEGWWETLWEGRLQVRDLHGRRKVKVPKGTPTWRRVQKLLGRAESKGKIIPGSTANRIAYGMVRVSYHGDYLKRGEWYAAVRPLLERRYKVTERYKYGLKYHQDCLEKSPDKDYAVYGDVWFEVAPKDGPYPPVNPAHVSREARILDACENGMGSIRRTRSYCDIKWAFIREDVWQSVLPLGGPNYTGWRDSPSVESEKEKLRTAIAKASEYAKVWERYLAIPMGEDRAEALKDIDFSVIRGEESCLEDTCYYLKCDYGREGMARQVKDMMDLRAKGETTPEQMDRLVQAVAEYAVIRMMMHVVCIATVPTHGGPQDGAWEAHKAFHAALAPVVANADPYGDEGDDEVTHDEGEEPEEEDDPEEGGEGLLNSIEPLEAPVSDVTDEEVTHADED
jgi:hypothetical protein